ncbi:MAG: serine/threonine protein kinase [Deltaproteobacteria bacterium]|nr:serine/threonine protein kinase [Deltaproteobacteria bacterium]
MSARWADHDAEAAASSSHDPFLGRVVDGRFRILDLIARGGMGRVYRAEQLPLGRLCALKVLHPRYDEEDDPEFQKRFFLEAATAAQLTHPNTVTVFDYGRDGATYFIAMEYLEGRTLYRILRDDGPLDEARVARILKQACRSLREAHLQGVIHRDMKPGNLLVLDAADEADTLKVLDFGLVKRVDDKQEDLTQEGMFMGSPKYMATEQILGNPVSPPTDVYAVGVVAYELLCGLPPFDEGTSVKTMMAHLYRPVPSLRARMRGAPLSPGMEALVMRCLEKEPHNRFASMHELLRALHELDEEVLTESLVGAAMRLPASRVAAPPALGEPLGDGTVVSGSPTLAIAQTEADTMRRAAPTVAAAGASGAGKPVTLPRLVVRALVALVLVGASAIAFVLLAARNTETRPEAGSTGRKASDTSAPDARLAPSASASPTDRDASSGSPAATLETRATSTTSTAASATRPTEGRAPRDAGAATSQPASAPRGYKASPY